MSLAYQAVVRYFHVLLRLFFRQVEVVGVENVPADCGGLLVAWHPNGLIDPALLLTSCPRPIVVGARHGLFKWPVLGAILRSLGAVPIYRAVDAAAGGGKDTARSERNRQSLDALVQKLAAGQLAALFPEGVSHDAPYLSELKVGAAKLYTQACELAPKTAPAPVILPVGLHYDDKTVFRSRALVVFHPPLVLPPMLMQPLPAGSSVDDRRARYTAITAEIERALIEIVRATESWRLHALMHRTRGLFRAERAHRAGKQLPAPSMFERELGYARVWTGYQAKRASDPDASARLLARVAHYDAELRALQIEDADIDADPSLGSRMLPAIALAQALSVYLLLPPILVVGFVANVVPYQLLRALAAIGAKLDKDVATIKLLAGALLFPASWGAFGWAATAGAWGLRQRFGGLPSAPVASFVSAVVLGIGGGFLLLRYQELAAETWQSLRVRWTRQRSRRTLAQLQKERGELFDALERMVSDVALPASVANDGRIHPG